MAIISQRKETREPNSKTVAQKVRRRRGSLAWLGRQTHNLERKGTRRPNPEVAGSNPAPGTTNGFLEDFLYRERFTRRTKKASFTLKKGRQFV
jgi:hypothetical protein